MEQQKRTKQQIKADLDAAGYGHQGAWVVGILLIAAIVFGIGFYFRWQAIRKCDSYEYTKGYGRKTYTLKHKTGRKTYSEKHVSIRFKPEGSKKEYTASVDKSYLFFGEPRVYYMKDDPQDCFIAMPDWLTGQYIPDGKNYDITVAIAGILVLVALYLFIDNIKAKRRAKKGTLKPWKSVKGEPYDDLYSHEISRIPGYKRSWAGAWFGFGMLYALFMTMGGAWTYLALKEPDKNGSFLIPGIIVLMIAQGAPLAIFLTARHLSVRKRSFIKAFMEDEYTAVYTQRKQAAVKLWKVVKHFMQAEPIGTKYKLAYERYWVEKFKGHLEKYR